MAAIFARLPKELQTEVMEYNPDHRPKMKQLCEELYWQYHRLAIKDVHVELEMEFDYRCSNLPFLYDLYRRYCDGYDCCNVYNDDFEYKQYEYLGTTFNFCCSRCQWEVTYDMRKSYRRSLRTQTHNS